MKKKLKWLINVATICLCLCAIAIGVYAAKQASLTATGTIGFTATNVYAEVSGQTTNAQTEVTFDKILIDSTKTGNPYTDTSTWSGKNINFNEEGAPITLTFTITNLSTGRPLYAKVTNTSSATNLNVKVNETDFTETEWLTISAKTEGSTANTTTVVISLSVANDNESVTGSYGFNIQLQSTEPVVEEVVLDSSTYTTLTFSYIDESAKTLSVVANSSNKPTGDLIIPSKVIFNGEECTVVSIPDTNPGAKSSFYDCTGITSITLPSTLTSIGMYAFSGCGGITGTLIIPDSVTNLVQYAFQDCSNITEVVIGKGINIINTAVFLRCTNLQCVYVGENVTSISDGVFSACRNMKYIYFGTNVTNIGGSAFQSCTSLDTIYFTGTEEEWNAITIGTDNEALTNATKVYNYVV
ncbi:MAG: leucine-rich repeat domain-containing protein [Clostridiales bacterium]|nr:leucine-rich repeat domain-containing protein [Clostridiales bacterium]